MLSLFPPLELLLLLLALILLLLLAEEGKDEAKGCPYAGMPEFDHECFRWCLL
jgi:hypothetical protein